MNRLNVKPMLVQSLIDHPQVVEPATAIAVVATEDDDLHPKIPAYRTRTPFPWFVTQCLPVEVGAAIGTLRVEALG
jgi:hypothetical protein